MDGYTTEQEQIDQIKKWWNENGKAIAFGLVLGLGGLFGYRYWESTRLAEGQSASINYEHLLTIASAGSSNEAIEAGEAIINGYPKTVYAQLSALVLAKLAVDTRDLEQAKARLQWVLDAAGDQDNEVRPVALARLAQIHLAEGNVDSAAAAVDRIGHEPADAFVEIKGDVLLAQGEIDKARALFSKALESSAQRGGASAALQLKLDNLALAGE